MNELGMIKSIPIAILLLITVVGIQQGASAIHDQNLGVNTWITPNGTQAHTINLNQGPASQPPIGEATVTEEEEGAAEADELPSPEPTTPTTTDEDEEEEEDETTPPDEEDEEDEEDAEDEGG
jgi:hypothetical protein